MATTWFMWKPLLKKLDVLRYRDPNHRLFGANGHGYTFHAVLSENAVLDFERKHRIQLPVDYRMFLTTVGNGGAGPFYGIFRLGEMDDGYEFKRWKSSDGFVGDLASPFPHSGPWNLSEEQLEPPEEFASDEDQDDWYEAMDAKYWSTDLVNGAFPICHHGCAYRTWLVVTGPEAGRVWFDERATNGGLRPHEGDDGHHLTFSEWFESWLDRCQLELG